MLELILYLNIFLTLVITLPIVAYSLQDRRKYVWPLCREEFRRTNSYQNLQYARHMPTERPPSVQGFYFLTFTHGRRKPSGNKGGLDWPLAYKEKAQGPEARQIILLHVLRVLDPFFNPPFPLPPTPNAKHQRIGRRLLVVAQTDCEPVSLSGIL